MVMRRWLLPSTVLLGWMCLLGTTGCNGSGTSPLQRNEPTKMIAYSINLPTDLPPGGWIKDKMDIPQYFSGDKIKKWYSGSHRSGWDRCLVELNSDWAALDRKAPVVFAQEYGWEERGYKDGYRACQSEVKTVVEKVGLEQAKQAVRNAIQAR